MATAGIRAAIAGAILAASAATSSTARAQENLAFGSWQTFTWIIQDGNGADPVDGAGFTFESMFQTRIRITDAGDAGDSFSIFLNGSPYLFTPSVSYEWLEIYDGDGAWGEKRFSQLEFLLEPGQWTITLAVREDAGYGYGEGFIRADQMVDPSVVPEPGTVLLTASGLVGILAIARRRRTRAAARPALTEVG